MRKFKIAAIACFIFAGMFTLFAAEYKLKWGGKGYDPHLKGENSSRFVARANFNDATMVDIWVDAKETVKDVGQIKLITEDGKEVSSGSCFQAMRHFTAPWACSFKETDLEELSGKGKLEVMNKTGVKILEASIDCEALKSFTQKAKEKTSGPGFNN